MAGAEGEVGSGGECARAVCRGSRGVFGGQYTVEGVMDYSNRASRHVVSWWLDGQDYSYCPLKKSVVRRR